MKRHVVRARCSSCNAPIEWAKFSPSGRAVPLDLASDKPGNLRIVGGEIEHNKPAEQFHEGGAKVTKMTYLVASVSKAELNALPPDELLSMRTSHFATCPNAKRHRKRDRS